MQPLTGTKRKRDHDESDSGDEMVPGRQILPVANLPADFDGEPMDGAQYLFTVRRDARKLPDVTRAENPYAMNDSTSPVPTNVSAQVVILPSPEWRDTFNLRFKHLRHNLSQPNMQTHIPSLGMMPPKKERDSWWAFLAGRPETDWKPARNQEQSRYRHMRGFSPERDPEEEIQEGYEEVWKINDDGEVELAIPSDPPPNPAVRTSPSSVVHTETYTPREPTLALISQVDHKTALHLLMYFTHWMNLHLRQPLATNLGSSSGLLESHARWMLSLLTRVDDYVSADEMHLLRNLARACIDVVKSFRKMDSSLAEGDFQAMSERSCWMVFTLIADYWAQRDLWMDAETALAGV